MGARRLRRDVASHYYQGQPELLQQAVDGLLGWLEARGLRD
ncbi:MAG: hypothetical protein RIM84_18935 [Alphaproteobacteria bacterium]